jgi:fructose-1-phosphate kinase PfkB-like protein
VKPNRDELARTVGRPLHSEDDLKDAMIEVHRRGAQAVLVSHGADPLWALCDGRLHVFRPPGITAVNPIGSGDCLAAGLATALSAGSDMVEAIRFGMAAAAENAAMLLTSRLDPVRVRARMDQVVCKALPYEALPKTE